MPDNSAASRSRPSMKLRDILMSDKPTLSYADFHHHITRNAESYLPKSSGSQQCHGIEGKAKEDELVRHMSSLPSYLEKGKNFQGKPLNVGVLDWRRLEKWNYDNNSMPQPHKNSGYSSATSSTSYFSTKGSSSRSSRGQSTSPAKQRIHDSSLQSHLEASPIKTYSQDKFYSGRGHSCSPACQRTCHLVPHSHHQKVYPWEGHSQSVDEISGSVPDHGIRQQKLYGTDQTCGRNHSRFRLEMSEKKQSDSNTTSEIGKETLGNSDVRSSWRGKLKIRESELKEAMQSRTYNLGDCHPDCSKEHNRVVLLVPREHPMNKGIAHLSDSVVSANTMPRDCGGKRFSKQDNFKEVRDSCPLALQEDSKDAKALSQQLSSPSRSRNTEEKKSIVVLKSSTTTDLSGELNNGTSSQSTTKVRHPSPIRRLGSAMGSIIRSTGSRDNSPLRRSSSKDPVAQPCLDKSQANSRARSSPLRRLLDPIIKPKAPNARESGEPLRKDTASTAGPWKSSDEQFDLLKSQSVKVKSIFTGGKNSHQNVKKGSYRLQALLQVAVKNGLPLFTFAVDNDSDILAATLRKKGLPLFTFFTVHEMKKKNALWLNRGSKSNGHYVPNVVAQMKGTDGDNMREFTLFSVDAGQADQHATEFQPTNELAAIVVKLPEASGSTTLILPGGVHTIPSKGSISTLTQRWRSGGSCDCGGWDVGCQLRIFSNQGESQKLLTSTKTANTSDEFKLFCQAGQESRAILSLNPFKDRIYFVEFDPSVSVLQAFATCVGVLDCRRESGLFSTGNMVEGRSSTTSVPGDLAQTKQPNQGCGEAPASYVSYPPHSPVGRV